MYCMHCGAILNDDWKFCQRCGRPTNTVPVLHNPSIRDLREAEDAIDYILQLGDEFDKKGRGVLKLTGDVNTSSCFLAEMFSFISLFFPDNKKEQDSYLERLSVFQTHLLKRIIELMNTIGSVSIPPSDPPLTVQAFLQEDLFMKDQYGAETASYSEELIHLYEKVRMIMLDGNYNIIRTKKTVDDYIQSLRDYVKQGFEKQAEKEI